MELIKLHSCQMVPIHLSSDKAAVVPGVKESTKVTRDSFTVKFPTLRLAQTAVSSDEPEMIQHSGAEKYLQKKQHFVC